ncbi:MAG: hypothetical protein IKP21_04530 [Bacteroidales bacterium]|nr:hypothetical protein [Bacteroidales bacterium]
MKNEKVKARRYTVALSECEMRRLTVYAAQCGVDRPTALSRLLRQSLREVAAGVKSDNVDEKQLGLFDALQIDIFNNTTKVNNKE